MSRMWVLRKGEILRYFIFSVTKKNYNFVTNENKYFKLSEHNIFLPQTEFCGF